MKIELILLPAGWVLNVVDVQPEEDSVVEEDGEDEEDEADSAVIIGTAERRWCWAAAMWEAAALSPVAIDVITVNESPHIDDDPFGACSHFTYLYILLIIF